MNREHETATTNEDLAWKPLVSHAAAQALDRIAHTWIGTPYRNGHRLRGIGCDCVQMVCGVYDDLFRCDEPTEVPSISPLAAANSCDDGYKTIAQFLRGWDGFDVINDGSVEPGDTLLTRLAPGINSPPRPAHALIAMNDPHLVLQATSGIGVHTNSLLILHPVITVYRPKRKDLWQ